MPLGTAYGMLSQAVGQYEGKYAQVGAVIKDMIAQRRETEKGKKELESSKELLRYKEEISPKEWKPTTKEEYKEVEQYKIKLQSGKTVKVVGKSLVDATGNVIYEASNDKEFKVVKDRIVEIDKKTGKARNITDWEGNILPEFQEGGEGGVNKTDFKTEAEALKAKLPKGTRITINGRPAIIE